MADATTVVRREAEPLAAGAGLDLLDVQVRGSGPRSVVRVVVARNGGVDVAVCRALSVALSQRLAVVDPVAGGYALEVTSPGVDHPLRTQRDFDRVEGRAVRVERRTSDGTVPVHGTVATAGDEAVEIATPGATVTVPYDEIVTARQVLPW